MWWVVHVCDISIKDKSIFYFFLQNHLQLSNLLNHKKKQHQKKRKRRPKKGKQRKKKRRNPKQRPPPRAERKPPQGVRRAEIRSQRSKPQRRSRQHNSRWKIYCKFCHMCLYHCVTFNVMRTLKENKQFCCCENGGNILLCDSTAVTLAYVRKCIYKVPKTNKSLFIYFCFNFLF